MGCEQSNQTDNLDWFESCKHGNLQHVCMNKHQYSQSFDDKEFCINNLITHERYNTAAFCNYDLRVQGFTGLMYAILYNQIDVIMELIDEEMLITTNNDIVLPVIDYSPFKQATIKDITISQQMSDKNVPFQVFIPKDSTILDLCVFINAMPVLDQILEYISKQPIQKQDQLLQHENVYYYNNLMLLIQLNNESSYQIFKKYGKLYIDSSFDYENVTGENCTYLSAMKGNYRFFSFFLSLACDANYSKTIKIQLDQSQFDRSVEQQLSELSAHAQYYENLKLFSRYSQGIYPQPPQWLRYSKNVMQKSIPTINDSKCKTKLSNSLNTNSLTAKPPVANIENNNQSKQVNGQIMDGQNLMSKSEKYVDLLSLSFSTSDNQKVMMQADVSEDQDNDIDKIRNNEMVLVVPDE